MKIRSVRSKSTGDGRHSCKTGLARWRVGIGFYAEKQCAGNFGAGLYMHLMNQKEELNVDDYCFQFFFILEPPPPFLLY